MNRNLLLVLAALVIIPLAAIAAAPSQSPGKKAPAHQGKLVFVSTTGLEDIGTLSSSFRHAKTAKESGYLSDVVWLSYGRAVVALDPTVKAVPQAVREEAQAAKAAGVRLVACGNALAKFGIDPKKLQPEAEVVDNGVAELSRLVAEGYQVIRY
ncbi:MULTISPECIES: DsrE family protein [unclassified Corallococcus]|uniref:DsrE family protein n=1 Tax=unclassified Corallococcus TaxID=2685029 RepID=UPI001A8E2164|nr:MULTISPECIES: DsrE family protein [unclassified Corallococcus]MBN9682521.1 DsrE family protein [Corallococcus sp. NCSPR001]WAS85927.1 DsrE family protein [Corallococcus sp. NCRR]